MTKFLFTFFCCCFPLIIIAQEKVEHISQIDLDKIPPQTIQSFWLDILDDGMSQPISIPIQIAKGKTQTPVLGLTAAIHGNELNGIPIIQQVIADIDLNTLNGTLIAIPGLNAVSISLHQRRFIDDEDLNRLFPGKENGNRSQQYVFQINKKVLSQLDYLIDMHTASFGRVNALYVRADLADERMANLAKIQDADIILNNKGIPSAAAQISATRTMRAEAVLQGIPAITIEYGNPQVFQPEMIARGKIGIQNTLSQLQMIPDAIQPTPTAIICKKSYWIFLDRGGYLQIEVVLNQMLKKGDLIATLRNPFGTIIKAYYSPEDGIVIGKSSNPVNKSGGRIIHLGILE